MPDTVTREVYGRFPTWEWIRDQIRTRSHITFYEWCMDRAWSYDLRHRGSAINPAP